MSTLRNLRTVCKSQIYCKMNKVRKNLLFLQVYEINVPSDERNGGQLNLSQLISVRRVDTKEILNFFPEK